MIGQKILIQKLFHQIDNGKFPRFSILIGEQGSGKKTLCYVIANRLGCVVSPVSNKIDTVREMIDTAYKVDLPVLYMLSDCDNMSNNSANALLKVIEEPPKNAYFVITCESADNLLTTIKSRGVSYMLEPYTYDEKCDFVESIQSRFELSVETLNRDDYDFLLDVCSVPGEIESLLAADISAFSDYVNLVIDNIAEVSGSNAFKISEKIALKDEDDKFSLKLFWKAFNVVCADRMLSDNEPLKYARVVALTGDYLQQLHIRGINKQMLFDSWILDVREEWL